MAPEFSVIIGVDAASRRKPFTFVALDPGRKLRVIGKGDTVDILSYLAGLGDALISFSPPWKGGKPAEGLPPGALLPPYRLGGLRQHSLLEENDPGTSPTWMAPSLSLLSRLLTLNFSPFPHSEDARQWLEAPAESAYRSLLGVEPFPSNTLEGRIQRQLVLYDLELDVPDPMEFFEEVTRFRLLRSQLPYERILPQAELNAWMAAATAWLAVHEPSRVHSPGSPAEGLVYLPLPKS
jgi:hypothetical protein